MKSLDCGRYALSCVAVALLTGCGGLQPPIGAPGAMPQTVAITPYVGLGKSRVQSAESGDLIYATGFGRIYILTFPDGTLVGTIHDNLVHGNACTDGSGNVFVPAYNSQTETGEIDEYAHGATTPTIVITEPYREPGVCSIDRTTGNLSFTDYDTSGKDGIVAVYESSTVLRRYHIHNGYELASCGYDNGGNLYAALGGTRQLYELRAGEKSFRWLRLGQSLGWPGRIQWYGGFLTIEEEAPNPAIDRVVVSGSTATMAGRTPLRINGHSRYHLASWIYRSTVIAPIGWRGAILDFWNYPKAGKPTKSEKRPKRWMQSVTVSVAR